jgi:predicted nucleotidyltransferase
MYLSPEIIQDLTNCFPGIEALYLFGSHATGEADADSDVDLAVYLAEQDLQANPCLDLEIGLFMEKKLRCPIDVVVMQWVSPILQHQVLAHGRRLFERNPAHRAVLESLSFKRYLDARHYQRKRLESSTRG